MQFYFDVHEFIFKTTSAPHITNDTFTYKSEEQTGRLCSCISTLLFSLCLDKLGPVVKTNLPVDGQDKDCHQDSNITDDESM